jgi:hypothetical protein
MANDSNTTSTLDTNLNRYPYNSDYDPQKNYVLTLFKSGYGIQGRELNNLEQGIQHQISRFENHIFKEGSLVRGGQFNLDLSMNYARVDDLDQYTNPVSIDNFSNTIVTSSTGVKALIKTVKTGSINQFPDTKTLIFKYISAGNNGEQTFLPGDILSTTDFNCVILPAANSIGLSSIFTINEGTIYTKSFNVDFPTTTVVLSKYSNKPTCLVGFDIIENIITANDDETLYDNARGFPNYMAPGADRLQLLPVLSVYTANDVPNNFLIMTELVDGEVQKSNERPMYSDILNEFARRSAETNGDFVVNGMNIRCIPHLNTGNNGGHLFANQGGDKNKLMAVVEPGVCFVYGFEYNFLASTYIPLERGIAVDSGTTISVPIDYGCYIDINEIFGIFDTNSGNEVKLYNKPLKAVSNCTYSNSTIDVAAKCIAKAKVKNTLYLNDGLRVYLDNISLQTVDLAGTLSTTALDHTIVGTDTFFTQEVYDGASILIDNKLYTVDYVSNDTLMYITGRPESNDTLLLGKIVAGNFKEIRSIYQEANSTIIAAGGDVILEGNNCILREPTINSKIFKINAPLPVTSNVSYDISSDLYFRELFSSTVGTDGTFSIQSGHNFIFNYYNVPSYDKTLHISVVPTSNIVINLPGLISADYNKNFITGVGTNFFNLNIGDNILINRTDVYKIKYISSATQIELTSNTVSVYSGYPIQKIILAGENISMASNNTNNIERTVIQNSNTSLSFNLNDTILEPVDVEVSIDVISHNNNPIQKIKKTSRYVEINTSTHENTQPGPWSLGISDVIAIKSIRMSNSVFSTLSDGTDVTNNFSFDSGQTDSLYGLGKIMLNLNSNLVIANNDYLLVEFDYFQHDMTSDNGYYNIFSYPIDDANTSNTNAITTTSIPSYLSISSGERYDLSKCIDTRFTIKATANDVDDLTHITINPSALEVVDVPSSGLVNPLNNTAMEFTFKKYMGRKDAIGVTSKGNITVISGQSRLDRITPPYPAGFSPLGTIDIPPYPSLTSIEGTKYPYTVETISIEKTSNRRYTMRDIGSMDKRLKNVEYYTSLNQLEIDTKNMQILDENGLNRFKCGFFSDPFTSSGVGDITNIEFKSSIDTIANELRPTFCMNDVQLVLDDVNSSNITRRSSDARLKVMDITGFVANATITQGNISGKISAVAKNPNSNSGIIYVENITGVFTNNVNVSSGTSTTLCINCKLPPMGDLITLKYTNKVFAEQNFGTTTTNIGGLEWNWKGVLHLYPEIDNWVDTTKLPDSNIIVDTNYDTWKNLPANSAWVTTWNSWQVISTGVTTQQRSVGPASTVKDETPKRTVIGPAYTIIDRPVYVGGVYYLTLNQTLGALNMRGLTRGYKTFPQYFDPSAQQLSLGSEGTHLTGWLKLWYEDIAKFITNNPTINWDSYIPGYTITFRNYLLHTRPSNNNGFRLGVYFTIDNKALLSHADVDSSNTSSNSSIYNVSIVSADAMRTGTSSRVVFDSKVVSNTTAVTDSSLNAYMRPKVITFIGQGLKPNAKVYPFFDNIRVSEYCTSLPNAISTGGGMIAIGDLDIKLPNYSGVVAPTLTTEQANLSDLPSPTLGSELLVDSLGNIIGIFSLPSDEVRKFTCGTKKFRLTDSITNSDVIGETTSSAEAYYTGQGLTEQIQKTVVSSRTGKIETINVTENGNGFMKVDDVIKGTSLCPIAQGFKIDIPENVDGAFFSKVWLYFHEKDATLPFEIMLREMDTGGNILPTIVPFSHVLTWPDEVTVSELGEYPTEIHFDSLVYLKNNTNYAMVVKPSGGNPYYSVMTATLGDRDLITGQPCVRKPYIGNFYVSSNDSEYSIVQEKKLKFVLFRAEFDTSNTGTAIIVNSPVEVVPVNDMKKYNQAAEPMYSETRLALAGQTGAIAVGESITGTTSGTTGTVSYIDSTNASANIYYISDVTLAAKFETNVGEHVEFSGGTTAVTSNATTVKFTRNFSEILSNSNEGLLILDRVYVSNNIFGNTIFLRDGEQLKSQITGNYSYAMNSSNSINILSRIKL